jgi:two-component system LytT family response regulator
VFRLKKVLIIEDKNDNLNIIESVFDNQDFTIHYSHDKKDGVEIAFYYVPDLILFHFSGQQDVAHVRKLLRNDATSAIPLIIISSSPAFEEQRMLMEIGVEDYLPESFIRSSLLKTIETRFEKVRKLRQNLSEQLNSFEKDGTPEKQKDHLLVKLGTKLKIIKFNDIICITALKEYTKIKTNDNSDVLVRKSMRNWIDILPPKSFLRIHRGTIINLSYIDKINQTGVRTYTVSLKGITSVFDFSYRYANIMRRSFPG